MTKKENMSMSDQMQGGMAEVIRLMQEGDLAEATAVIQRTLGGNSLGSRFAPVASPDAPSGADEPIDVESNVVDEAPHPTMASRAAAGRRPAAAPRGPAPRPPGGPADPIDVETNAGDKPPPPPLAGRPPAGRSPAPAPRPAASPLLFGSVPLTMPDSLSLTLPDSMPLTMPGG